MIQDRMQYLLSRDHQHHKWQLQKSWIFLSRQPGCPGQAADAVSAHTQVKMEDAPSLLKIPKSECPEIWIRLPKHKWPKSLPSRSSWAESVRSSSGRTFLGKASRESSLKIRFGKSSKLGLLICKPRKGLFLAVHVDDIKKAGEKQNINPTWKVLAKEVDLCEPTSFLDNVFFWVALNENAKRAKILWTTTEICLNLGSLPEQKQSFLVQVNLTQTSPHCLMMWKVMQRTVWTDYASRLVTDAWLAWFLKFITQVNLSNVVMWETLRNNAGWDCFRGLTLPEILKTQKSTSGWILCIFGSHTFCSSKLDVCDAGPRMDGVPALDLWDLVIEVLHSSFQPT